MSDLGTALPAYPVPTPRPTPPAAQPPAAAPVAPPAPVTPPQAPAVHAPAPFDMNSAGQNFLAAGAAQKTATERTAAAEAKAGTAKSALQATQSEYVEGLHKREEQELRGLDQGEFKPTHDTLAGMGALFTMVGMMGAFMGGRGASSAAANAQAAMTGIIGGWNKGEDEEVARQKQVFDENANYLKQKADKVREIYKDYEEDALKVGVPTAQGRLQQRLLTEADADVNAAKVQQAGAAAGAKQAEDIFKMSTAFEEKKRQLDEQYFFKREELAIRRQAQQQFSPTMGDLMGALAEKGVSLPTGLRSQKQQFALYQGLLERHPGMSVDQIADLIKGGQIDLKAELKETQIAAGIAGRVGVASQEITPMGDLVLGTAAKVPRGKFLPVNKLLRAEETQLQDPHLRTLQVQINSMLNAYDVLAARGGTDAAKRETAHRLLTDADSPETLAAGVQAFKQEADIAEKAAYRTTHKYGGGGKQEPSPKDDELLKKYGVTP